MSPTFGVLKHFPAYLIRKISTRATCRYSLDPPNGRAQPFQGCIPPSVSGDSATSKHELVSFFSPPCWNHNGTNQHITVGRRGLPQPLLVTAKKGHELALLESAGVSQGAAIKGCCCAQFAFFNEFEGKKPPEDCEKGGHDPAKTQITVFAGFADLAGQ